MRLRFQALGLIIVTAIAAGGWWLFGSHRPVMGQSPAAPAATIVEVVTPKAGGADRVCSQPGTLEPLQAADLYAKVSGYLSEQLVDIGDRVKAGDVLARIAVPELDKQLLQDAAEIARAKAKVDQAAAAIDTAQADLGAATAGIALAKADLKSKSSFREFREKQLNRIKGLVASSALDAKLADEHEDQFQAAASAELVSREAIVAAQQKETAAKARVVQAAADKKLAEADVVTAEAKRDRTRVLVDFAVLRAPYTGVVTRRNFHPGDFIRSADSGGERIPVLAVERTDVMRVVIQVPERDVPFVDVGDPAVLEIDALPGVHFTAEGPGGVRISRVAASEDPHSRMMRTEVLVNNDEGKLRRGMYGRVVMTLDRGGADRVRIPSAALSGKADDGKASVRVVRDGHARVVPIRYSVDSGAEVDVLSGLAATDAVIVRAAGPLADGDAVTVSATPR